MLAILVGVAFVIPLQLLVTAQDSAFPTLTPQPSPTNNGGGAAWTVAAQTFTSNYPLGWSFTLQASSSAGKIKNATAIWKHSPVSLRRAGGTFNEQTNTWEFAWESSSGAVPAWVSIHYWFVLEDEQGNFYTTDPWQTEYADNTKPWGRLESEDIIIFYERPIPDAFGTLVVSAMEESRERYREGWGSLLSYKPRAIFYATRQSYFEWNQVGNNAGRRDVGLTQSSWGGTVQYNYNGNLMEAAYGTVLHEVAHLYQADKRSSSNLTWWVEGQATFFEMPQGQMYDYLERAKMLALTFGLGSIYEDWGGNAMDIRDPYDLGYAFIFYLTETYGLSINAAITEQMASGKTLFEAISSAAGKPLDEIEYEYRDWLGLADPTVPTAFPTMAFQFPPTPTFPPRN
jgi:hypothetical protein